MTSPPRRSIPLEILDLIISECSHSTLLAWCLTSKRTLAFAGPLLVREVTLSGDEDQVMAAIEKLSSHRLPPSSNLLLPLSFAQTRTLTLNTFPNPYVLDDFYEKYHRSPCFNIHTLRVNVPPAVEQIWTKNSWKAFYAPRLLALIDPQVFIEENFVTWDSDTSPDASRVITVPTSILRFYHLAQRQLHPWSLDYLLEDVKEQEEDEDDDDDDGDLQTQLTKELSSAHSAILRMARDQSILKDQLPRFRVCADGVAKKLDLPVPAELQEWMVEAEREFDDDEECEQEVLAALSWRDLLITGTTKCRVKVISLNHGQKLMESSFVAATVARNESLTSDV